MTSDIKILAADSMGVRSLATYIEICGYKVIIDPGASLAPRRYGLPPHNLEVKRLSELRKRIEKTLVKSNIVIITHYHYDHYIRDKPDLFTHKTLIVKDPNNNINKSQKIRAWKFLKKSGLYEKAEVLIADKRKYRFGDLVLEFSDPVWHGDEGSKVGKVVMVRLLCGTTSIVFTSDVQGPADLLALETLKAWSMPRPELLVLCGPPTYFAGYKVPKSSVNKGLRGVKFVIERVRPSTLVIDHHIIRDINFESFINTFKNLGRNFDVNVMLAAEFMGLTPEPLEARRKILWRGEG